VFAFIEIQAMSLLTKAFPMIAIALILVSVIALVIRFKKRSLYRADTGVKIDLFYIACFFVLIMAYYYIGFITSTVVFTLIFLRVVTKSTMLKSATVALGLLIFLVLIGHLMSVEYPAGLVDPYLYQLIK
jgi:hypothetical protein